MTDYEKRSGFTHDQLDEFLGGVWGFAEIRDGHICCHWSRSPRVFTPGNAYRDLNLTKRQARELASHLDYWSRKLRNHPLEVAMMLYPLAKELRPARRA